MRIAILLGIFSGLGFVVNTAQAHERVSFQTAAYSILCEKPRGECKFSQPVLEKAEVELFPDASGNQIGRYHQQSEEKGFAFGGDILISHSNKGYYLLFITSWIQDLTQEKALRSQASVSVTVNSLSELNRLNLPSPDLENEGAFGHGQFMIWAEEK